MSKQKKLLNASNPNSFFDEMEREVNSTKRKKCKKVNPVPPEKLFLQFDPSKMEKYSISKSTNKAHWKPPTISQPENFDLDKNIDTIKSNFENNICSKTNENTFKVGSASADNLNIIRSRDCLEKITPENDENMNEGNTESVTINLTDNSSSQSSPESLLSVQAEKISSQSANPHGTSGEIMLLGSKTETVTQEMDQSKANIVVTTCNEVDIVTVKNMLYKLAPDGDCNEEISEPITGNSSKSSNIHQELNAVSEEEEIKDNIDKISKLTNVNNPVEQNSDLFEKESISHANEILKVETSTKTVLPGYNDINIQPIDHFSENEKSQVIQEIPSQTDLIASANNLETDFLQIKVSSVILNEINLSQNEEPFVKYSESEIGDKNNLNSTQCSGKSNSQTVETVIFDMTHNTVKYDKSEISIEGSVVDFDAACTNERLNDEADKIQIQDIAQTSTNQLDELNPIVTKNSPKLQMTTEINKDVLISTISCNLAILENSCVAKVPENEVCKDPEQSKSIITTTGDDNHSSGNVFDQDNSEISLLIDENIESYVTSDGSQGLSVIEEEEIPTKENIIYNNIKEKCSSPNDKSEGQIYKNNTDNELLEEEDQIQEEKVDLDEDYSCLMISNSELEEIENNYYKSSQQTKTNNADLPKVLDTNLLQQNQLLPDKNKYQFNFKNTEPRHKEPELERVNVFDNQTNFGQKNSSDSTLQNILPKPPNVQCPKNMLEMQKRIRGLTAEVDRLNSLLLGLIREKWPQKHGSKP